NTGFPFQLYPGYPTCPPPAPPKPWSLAYRITIIALIALVVLAPIGLIAGVVYGFPAYRAWYQNELIRRVHAQRPLFEDKLTLNDGKWPAEGVNEYHESYYFAFDGYHLTGQDPNRLMGAWGSTDSTDVAIELTAKQHGSAKNDGVGVLVRASSD